jgi:hypothetical protein
MRLGGFRHLKRQTRRLNAPPGYIYRRSDEMSASGTASLGETQNFRNFYGSFYKRSDPAPCFPPDHPISVKPIGISPDIELATMHVGLSMAHLENDRPDLPLIKTGALEWTAGDQNDDQDYYEDFHKNLLLSIMAKTSFWLKPTSLARQLRWLFSATNAPPKKPILPRKTQQNGLCGHENLEWG